MKESGVRGILRVLNQGYKLGKINKVWRKHNLHNKTRIGCYCDHELIQVGNYTYGIINVNYDNTSKLRIGNFVSIADNVHFLTAGEHYLNTISTFPVDEIILKKSQKESMSKGDIVICDDVWIGYGATILSGVTIGQGAVIACGAVVTKDVPPYAVVGGNPAKVIKMRHSQEDVERLLAVDFSSINDEFIFNHHELFYSKDILRDHSKFPQK